ncbi:MAG: hypothetical protein QOF51_3317 [Chloroflexota bacterium]|jgi:predicted N-acetyltransferase YhbS|nr:hypothetical protein [Chloroflexota bacterium]
MASLSQLVLRDARPEELDAVSAIIRAAYAEYASMMPADRWTAYIERATDVRSRAQLTDLIVAELDGRLLGSITYYPQGPASTDQHWPPGWVGLRLLAVTPEGRGLGIGRALMEECVRRGRAQGAMAVGLHTTERMAIGKAMYERMGFERVPASDFGGGGGTTVLAYRLDLTAPTVAIQGP